MKTRWLFTLATIFTLIASSFAYAMDIGTPAVIPNEPGVHIGLGPSYDLTTRTLAVESDGRIGFQSNRLLLNFALSPSKYIAFRLMGGVADMRFRSADFSKMSGLADSTMAEDAANGFSAPFNIAGGGAIDIAFLKDPNKFVGLGVTGFGLTQAGSDHDVKVNLTEYGGAVTLSAISLGTIIPYMGFDYTGVQGTFILPYTTETQATGTAPAVITTLKEKESLDLAGNPDSPVGVFAGLNLTLGDNFRMNLEGRFLNETSGGFSFMYNF